MGRYTESMSDWKFLWGIILDLSEVLAKDLTVLPRILPLILDKYFILLWNILLSEETSNEKSFIFEPKDL